MAKYFALVVALLAWTPFAAWADSGDVVVLLTEIVGEGVDGSSADQVGFWWSSADNPQWTKSDDAVFQGLREAGVGPMTPQKVNISRIYRRPGLSPANAAQLGGLLNVNRVLVGQIEYRPIKAVAPLGYHGVEVRAEVELVAAGSTDGVSLQRFTVQRRVYGSASDALLEEARAITGAALGEVMGRSLRRSGGEIGVQGGATLLAVRNVERAANLESLRSRLLAIEEVDRVVERWASEGIIALEINPGSNTPDDIAEYVFRVVENHEFDDFRIQRSERRTEHGVVEFWVEPRDVRY